MLSVAGVVSKVRNIAHKMCQNSFLFVWCSPYHHSSQHIYPLSLSQESTNGLRYHDDEYENDDVSPRYRLTTANHESKISDHGMNQYNIPKSAFVECIREEDRIDATSCVYLLLNFLGFVASWSHTGLL